MREREAKPAARRECAFEPVEKRSKIWSKSLRLRGCAWALVLDADRPAVGGAGDDDRDSGFRRRVAKRVLDERADDPRDVRAVTENDDLAASTELQSVSLRLRGRGQLSHDRAGDPAERNRFVPSLGANTNTRRADRRTTWAVTGRGCPRYRGCDRLAHAVTFSERVADLRRRLADRIGEGEPSVSVTSSGCGQTHAVRAPNLDHIESLFPGWQLDTEPPYLGLLS